MPQPLHCAGSISTLLSPFASTMQVEGHAARLQAALAADAQLGVHLVDGPLDLELEHAGELGDDHGGFLGRQLFAQHPLDQFEVVRVVYRRARA